MNLFYSMLPRYTGDFVCASMILLPLFLISVYVTPRNRYEYMFLWVQAAWCVGIWVMSISSPILRSFSGGELIWPFKMLCVYGALVSIIWFTRPQDEMWNYKIIGKAIVITLILNIALTLLLDLPDIWKALSPSCCYLAKDLFLFDLIKYGLVLIPATFFLTALLPRQLYFYTIMWNVSKWQGRLALLLAILVFIYSLLMAIGRPTGNSGFDGAWVLFAIFYFVWCQLRRYLPTPKNMRKIS